MITRCFLLIATLPLSFLAANLQASDSTAIRANPTVSLTIATVGQPCSANGLRAFASSGTLLSCQGSRWSQLAVFKSFDTTTSAVNRSCPGGDDFTLIQYNLTCATRYCAAKNNAKFGHITEYGAGFNSDKPYKSDPNTYINVSCAK